jgi:hypothetical protein
MLAGMKFLILDTTPVRQPKNRVGKNSAAVVSDLNRVDLVSDIN